MRETPTPPPPGPNDAALAQLAGHLRRLRFGSLRLAVHDGRITELEIVEKKRFP